MIQHDIQHDKGVNKILMHTSRGNKLINKVVAFVCAFSYDLLIAHVFKFNIHACVVQC
jgi:hypothetical protein